MVAFYLALVIGIVVGVAYLALAFQELQRIRRAPAVVDDDGPETFDRQGGGFAWVAGGGVVVSTSLLVLASLDGVFWYAMPFLGIGSALAVVVAFLVDQRQPATAAQPEVPAHGDHDRVSGAPVAS